VGKAARGPTLEEAGALGREIERLANQFLAVPGPAVDAPLALTPGGSVPPAGTWTPPAGTPAPAPATAPPAWGPSALAVGAGGASPAVALPPVPGPIKQPPLPMAPPPRESDLRVIPGMLSDALGVASPVATATAMATGPEPAARSPYFLEIAGLPSAAPGAPPGSAVPPSGANPGAVARTPLIASPVAGELATPLTFSLPLSVTNALEPATEPYFLGLAGIPTSAVPRRGPSHAPPPVPLSDTATPSVVPGLPSRPSVPLSFPGWASAVPSDPPTSVADGAAAAPSSAPSPSEFRPELVPDVRASDDPFDGATIKKDFPILRERVHGRPLVWLDNAATTQKPQVVIDRLAYYYEHENSNVHRAAHALAARATDAYEGARDTVRRFLNASSAQDIVFVRGTTEAINLVAKSWGARYVGPGDEIVITWLEHHANIVPWQQLCADKGACLRVAPVDDRGQVILEQYERLLGPRTRLVAFSQVSNALGTIAPAQPMIEMAHRHGALVLVDGAQAVSHMRVDVQALDCDFYCFSGHKVFAPTGIGALYGKPDVLSSMPPWQGGGNMISNVTFEKTSYQPPPQRFEAGTSSIGDAVGLGAALDYVSSLGMENISRYEHELLVYATEGLERVPGLRLIGTAPDKAAVLSFVLDGVRTEDVGTALDQEGIAVRSGHHCAQPILRRFGLESTVRASLAPYNTREDIDALVAALLRLQAGRPQLRAAG